MKKPLSIRGNVKILSLTVYPYQKISPVFSLRAVIHEFFQKKLNYIKATKFFLTIPKPLKQYTLFKKRLSITLSKA